MFFCRIFLFRSYVAQICSEEQKDEEHYFVLNIVLNGTDKEDEKKEEGENKDPCWKMRRCNS
jgi:hypothetical protein